MNAQEIWKELYREWKWKPVYETGGNYPKYSWRGMMRDYRREAALERRLASAQHTIEAQAQEIKQLQELLDMANLAAWHERM